MTTAISVMAGVARADSTDAKALAKAQFMLRQLSGERDALQSENAKLKAELEALKAKSDGAQRKSRETTTALSGRLEETQALLDRTLAEKGQLEQTATERGQQLEQCATKNARLHELNSELLQRYADKGVFDALVQREPLTGLKQVELENRVQDLQDKLDEQRVVTGQTSQAVTPPEAAQ
ncbi:MAG: hypothetical protein L0Y32_03190 [Nevskiales bacterium]|nr:hypothetical protein [Nevskiales bacterium]